MRGSVLFVLESVRWLNGATHAFDRIIHKKRRHLGRIRPWPISVLVFLYRLRAARLESSLSH